MAILKTFTGKTGRRAFVKSPSASQTRRRLRGRYCVSVSLFPKERKKSAVRGVTLALKEVHGCYVSRKEADRVAQRLANKARL